MAKKQSKRAAPAKKSAQPKAAPTTTAPQEAVTPTQVPTLSPEPLPETPAEVHKIGHKIFLGAWAYVLGLIVALAAALFRPQGLDYYTILVLALFGFVVGLMNITDEEVLLFLVASLAFIVSTTSVRAVLPTTSEFTFVLTLLHGIILFTGAGAFVVAFKALFKVAKSE